MQHLDIITNEFCMQILLSIIFLIWNEAHARTTTLQRTSSLISKLLCVGLFPDLFATVVKKNYWTRTKHILWKHWLLTWLSNRVGFGKIKSCKRWMFRHSLFFTKTNRIQSRCVFDVFLLSRMILETHSFFSCPVCLF